jgi:5'-3' exonuclease
VTIALIDGDILTYRTGFSSRDIPLSLALSRLNKTIENICKACDAKDYNIYLTSQDHSNFRFEVDPTYKANRSSEKPPYYTDLREYMTEVHKAEIAFGCEADDLLGINQNEDTIICTIDKDLKQIPGRHYNFVKDYHYTVTPQEGLHWFYTQIVTGDNADNVKGLAGIGPRKAELILGGECLSTSKPKLAHYYYLSRLIPFYKKQYSVLAWEKICTNGALLKIKEKENEPIWHPKHYLYARDLKKLLQSVL